MLLKSVRNLMDRGASLSAAASAIATFYRLHADCARIPCPGKPVVDYSTISSSSHSFGRASKSEVAALGKLVGRAIPGSVIPPR